MKFRIGRKQGKPSVLVIGKNENLDGFLYKAGPQTSRANFDPLSRAIDKRSDTLKIGAKHPVGFIVGMTDIVPSHSFLSAN